MHIEYAFLASSVTQLPDGRLNVVGGFFEDLTVDGFPALLPATMLVFGISFQPPECDRYHHVETELCDCDGVVIKSFERGQIFVPSEYREPERPRLIIVPADWSDVSLAKAGRYTFRMMIDGQEMKSLPLYIREFNQDLHLEKEEQ